MLREREGRTHRKEKQRKRRRVDIHTVRERAQPALDRPDPRRDLFQSYPADHRGMRKDSPHHSIKSTYEWAGFDQIIVIHSVLSSITKT